MEDLKDRNFTYLSFIVIRGEKVKEYELEEGIIQEQVVWRKVIN